MKVVVVGGEGVTSPPPKLERRSGRGLLMDFLSIDVH